MDSCRVIVPGQLSRCGQEETICHVVYEGSPLGPSLLLHVYFSVLSENLWAPVPRVWERQQRNTSLCRSYCNCITTSLQKKSVSPVQSFLVV